MYVYVHGLLNKVEILYNLFNKKSIRNNNNNIVKKTFLIYLWLMHMSKIILFCLLKLSKIIFLNFYNFKYWFWNNTFGKDKIQLQYNLQTCVYIYICVTIKCLILFYPDIITFYWFWPGNPMWGSILTGKSILPQNP